MPKSKMRKDHKKKVLAYKRKIAEGKRSIEKEMKNFYEKQQMEMLEKQINNNEISQNEISGIDSNDFKLNDELLEDNSTFKIVEEVSSEK